MEKEENMRLIRECNDSRIYECIDSDGHFIVKELLTPKRIESMKKEIAVCNKLKGTFSDFPCVVPKITENGSIFRQEYIDGKHYLELNLSTAQKVEITRKLIYWIQKMEEIEVDEQDYISGIQWKNQVREAISERVDKIAKLNIVDTGVLNNVVTWINTQADNISNDICPVYVHNDLNKENILINYEADKVNVYIIDFEKISVADPLKEISKLVWLFRADKEFGDVFWSEYTRNNSSSLGTLKAYWVFDILYHLEKHNEFNQLSGWDRYLEEEIEILSKVTEEDYKLW